MAEKLPDLGPLTVLIGGRPVGTVTVGRRSVRKVFGAFAPAPGLGPYRPTFEAAVELARQWDAAQPAGDDPLWDRLMAAYAEIHRLGPSFAETPETIEEFALDADWSVEITFGPTLADGTAQVVRAITQFRPDAEGWRGLDRLLQDLWAAGEPGRGMDALFGVFERFPDEDGGGVFWTILHGLEGLPGYEGALVASLRRRPTGFGVVMVNRILNAGQAAVGGVAGLTLLQEALTHPSASEETRQQAQRYTERHPAPLRAPAGADMAADAAAGVWPLPPAG